MKNNKPYNPLVSEIEKLERREKHLERVASKYLFERNVAYFILGVIVFILGVILIKDIFNVLL